MKKAVALLLMSVMVLSAMSYATVIAGGQGTGFDEFGYNDRARIFVGTGESWAMGKLGYTHAQAEAYMGIYAHDQLIMKWNAEWDRGNAENWLIPPYGAWEDNEWNGQVPDGSGEIWHYKIIWVGTLLEASPYWVEGGYAIWGQFEVIMSQGTVENEHIWDVLATPCGYG